MRVKVWIPRKNGKPGRFHGYRWEPMSGPYTQALSLQAFIICACIEWGKRYNNQKQQGKRTDLTSDQNDTKLNTAEKIAEAVKYEIP